MPFIFQKFLKKKKNILVLTIIGLALLLFFFWTRTTSNVSQTLSTLQSNIQSIQQEIKTLEKAISQTGAAAESADQLIQDENNLAQSKTQLTIYEEQKQALNDRNYNKYYDLQDKLDKQMVQIFIHLPVNQGGGGAQSKNSINMTKNSIIWYQEVKKSGQNFPAPQEQDPAAFGVALELSGDLYGIMAVVIFAVLCSDFLDGEFPNGLRFYELIKFNRKKLLWNYLLIPTLIPFAFILAIFFLYFLFVGFTQGWGSPMFPFGGGGSYVTMPVWQVGVWAIIYLFLTLLFLTSLGQLLTVLFKRPFLSTAVVVILLVAYIQLLQSQDFMKGIIRWVPLTYLGSSSVVQFSGGFPAPWPFGGNYLFGSSSLWVGVFYLLACSVLFYLLTNMFFSRYIYRKA